MDPLHEEEILAEEPTYVFDPISYVLQLLAAYGWYALGAGAAALYAWRRARPAVLRWRQATEDAEYHKDPDAALARMEAVRAARDKQQRSLEAASERALQLQREREERKRQEAVERMRKYGAAGAGAGGHRLGAGDDEYLPLAGGGAGGGGGGGGASSYRAPRRSACGRGGGCGR